MGTLEDFGHGILSSRLAPTVAFAMCYVTYEGRPPPTLPARFGSVDDALQEWVFGRGRPGAAPFPGSVVDFFNRTLGIALVPIGGERVWYLSLTTADYMAGGQVRPGEQLRALVKDRLAQAMTAAGVALSSLDADADHSVESPGGDDAPPELLVLALDNLGVSGGQTGGTDPWEVSIGPNCTWSGEISGLAVGTGVQSMTHELLHQYGTADLYGAGFGRNVGLTTMTSIPGNPDSRVRLDPWHEMQFGVTTPIVVDMTVPGSVTIDHAGGDGNRRAVLLSDPNRRFEGFLVQLRVGKQDPIDLFGPNGWCLWQVAVDAVTHGLLTFPSWRQAGGLDASINHLASKTFDRGQGPAWSDGTTPELSWWNGAETGVALTFARAADGLSGTVAWNPVASSWRHRAHIFEGFDVGTLPCQSAPGITTDPTTGWPVIGARSTTGDMRLNAVLDPQSLSPWAVPPVVQSSQSVTLTRSQSAVAAAYLSSGRVLVDYPPLFASPSDCGAVSAQGRPAIAIHGSEIVVAWCTGNDIVVAHRTPTDTTWTSETIPFQGQFDVPMAGTSPSLVSTASMGAKGTCMLAWTGADGLVRIRRRDGKGSWSAQFALDFGTVPAVLELDTGFGTSGSPALAVGPGSAVWVAVQMASLPTHVAYGRAPAALGGLEPNKPTFWRPFWRHIEVGPMTDSIALAGDANSLTVAFLPSAGSPIRLGPLPTA